MKRHNWMSKKRGESLQGFHLCILYISLFFRGEWYYFSTTTELWSKYWWDWNSGKISFFKANNTTKIKYRIPKKSRLFLQDVLIFFRCPEFCKGTSGRCYEVRMVLGHTDFSRYPELFYLLFELLSWGQDC